MRKVARDLDSKNPPTLEECERMAWNFDSRTLPAIMYHLDKLYVELPHDNRNDMGKLIDSLCLFSLELDKREAYLEAA